MSVLRAAIMLSVAIFYCYGECRYAECHYDECRYAECRYSECRGAVFSPWGQNYKKCMASMNSTLW